MKYYISIVVAIILVAAAAPFSQATRHPGKRAQAKTTVPEWMEFQSPEFAFHVRFPTLGHRVQVALSRDGLGHSFQYWSKQYEKFYTLFTISLIPYAPSDEDEAGGRVLAKS